MALVLSSVPLVRVRVIRTANNTLPAGQRIKATPTVRSLSVAGQHGFIDPLEDVLSTLDGQTGVDYLDLVATDDPDVAESFGWTISLVGSARAARIVSVPQTGSIVEQITVPDAQGGGTHQMPAVWLHQLADFTGPSGATGSDLASRTYVDDSIYALQQAPDPFPQYAMDGEGGGSSTPDATTSVKGKAVLLGGTADNPTVPWSAVTGAPAVPAAYTDEQAQDAVGAALTGQSGKVSATYDDGNNHVVLDVQNLTKADVGLNNVNNTADANKPVSTSQQAALDLKANLGALAAIALSGSAADLLTGELADARIPAGITRDSELQAALDALVGASPDQRNTLEELNAALAADESAAAALTALVATKAQGFTVTAPKSAASPAYTFTAGDYVPADLASGSFTLTLPTGVPDKTRVGFKVTGVAANAALTIACSGSDKLNRTNGNTSYTATMLGQAGMLQYEAATGLWFVQADDLPLSQLDARYARLFVDRGPVTTGTSTTYNPGDLVTYQGRRVLITNQVTSTGFISAANFIALGKVSTFSAYDYGFRTDGNTSSAAANTAALKAAIAAASSVGGGVVELPPGYAFVAKDGSNPWAVELLSNVALRGQGMKATQLVLAPSQNCTVIRMHASTGAGNANAFYCSVAEMTIDGRKATQDSATGAYHGIDATTNPLTTAQSGDDGFDPHHFLHNLRIYTVAGNGVHLRGRSAIVVSNVFAWQCGGYGFDATFDTRFENCESMQSGLAGFRFANGQIQASNCKSYISGLADGTQGHGFLLVNTGLATGSLVGCTAQNNYAAGFYFTGAWGWSVSGCTADTNNYNNSGAGAWAGFHFDSTSRFNVLDVVSSQTGQSGAGQLGYQVNALALLGGSTSNDIRVAHYAGSGQTVGAAVATGSSLTGNRVIANGVSLTDTIAALTDVAISGTPADGAAFTFNGSTGKWVANAAAGTNFSGGIFGDGSDGAIGLDGTNTYTGLTKSGSTYTMTRDFNATSFTIASGAQLNCSGYRVLCTGTFTNNGTVYADGNAGNANGTAGAATGSGSVSGGVIGGAGNTGAGSAGSNGNYAALGVGGGGPGGAGASGAAGAQGFSQFGSTPWMYRTPHTVLSGAVGYNNAVKPVSGAPSGGGGGGDGTNKGGGGGGGAGAIIVLAKSIINTGALTAKGGAGGSPVTGNCGGGGGGGGGLILLYSTTPWANTGTTAVTGGSSGAGAGTGAAASNGANGTVTNFLVV